MSIAKNSNKLRSINRIRWNFILNFFFKNMTSKTSFAKICIMLTFSAKSILCYCLSFRIKNTFSSVIFHFCGWASISHFTHGHSNFKTKRNDRALAWCVFSFLNNAISKTHWLNPHWLNPLQPPFLCICCLGYEFQGC